MVVQLSFESYTAIGSKGLWLYDITLSRYVHDLNSLGPGGCFSNVSRALQNNLAKIYNASNHIYGENFKLKPCACAQSMALGTRTKFQLEMLIGSAISATHKFRENILESSQNVSETTPWWFIYTWSVNWVVNRSDDIILHANCLVPSHYQHQCWLPAGFPQGPEKLGK